MEYKATLPVSLTIRSRSAQKPPPAFIVPRPRERFAFTLPKVRGRSAFTLPELRGRSAFTLKQGERKAFTAKQREPEAFTLLPQVRGRFCAFTLPQPRERSRAFTLPQVRGRFTLPELRERSRAFTLIELLVVITIIIILMAFLFPAFRGVQDQAKRAQAKNDLTQMVTAIGAFYTEYGQYPCVLQTGDDSNDFYAADDVTQGSLMDTLRVPSPSSPPALNPRAIVFLNVAIAKDPNNVAGGPRSGIGGNGRWYDPWGVCYRIKIDNNYNGTLANPYSANAGFSTINSGVIAWSLGRNKTGGSGDKKSLDSDDDVISWQ
jgi:prepilin-type N-terminal cleavage/methylation domain-containing protein